MACFLSFQTHSFMRWLRLYERSLEFSPLLHTLYIAEAHSSTPSYFIRRGEVRRIFDTYKSRFGYGEDETLELVSAKSAKAA